MTIRTYDNLQAMSLDGELILVVDLVKYLQGRYEVLDGEVNKYLYDASFKENDRRLQAFGAKQELESILKELEKNLIKETK